MGTKTQELSEQGCFSSAGEGEPLFILRSTDPRAPAIVREWARQYLANRVRTHVEPLAGADVRETQAWHAEHDRRATKYSEAMTIADNMDRYRTAFEEAVGSGATDENAHKLAAAALPQL